MLETASSLATWQFEHDPSQPAGGSKSGCPQALIAKKLPDHRLAYLDYQGPVSKGRGEVKRVEDGSYDLLCTKEERWEVFFHGRRLKGRFEFVRQGKDDKWAVTGVII